MGNTYFTVYQTSCAIELHPGCSSDKPFRMICTCVYYQQACEIARLMSSIHRLPIRDLVISAEGG
jgi:surfactin synthase thioesterase subunit